MKPAATASLLILLTCNLPASATVTDAEFSQLRADLLGLLERVETLEAENREIKASSEKVMRQTAEKSSWSDSITLMGDLRYRSRILMLNAVTCGSEIGSGLALF